jgi:hypothetical protein
MRWARRMVEQAFAPSLRPAAPPHTSASPAPVVLAGRAA